MQIPKLPSQDFPRRASRNGIHENDASPQLLVAGDLPPHMVFEILLGDPPPCVGGEHDVRPRQLVPVPGNPDDSRVRDMGVRDEDAFELGGRHLQAFVLDQLLFPPPRPPRGPSGWSASAYARNSELFLSRELLPFSCQR